MLTTKQCPTCGKIKNISEYGIRRERNNAPKALCKLCEKEAVVKYQRTKKGVVNTTYIRQKRSSKMREYDMPTYTKLELEEWLFSQQLFHELYNNWKNCGYIKSLRPSVDRIDDYQSYTFNNIQLMTWGDNNKKAGLDMKEGRNNKESKSVKQLSKEGIPINNFYSMHNASRETGISQGGISYACSGKQKTAGGYVWEYN